MFLIFMRRLIKKHKKKIVICTSPILFLILMSYTSFIEPKDAPKTDISLTQSAEKGYAGDVFSVDVDINTDTPINVIEAAITFPRDLVSVSLISKADSLINIWVMEPVFLNDIGTINFSGGILQQGGFVKNGKAITVVFKTKKEGEVKIQVDKASFALADGLGTLVTPQSNEIIYTIEEKPVQSPDMNDSGTVNLVDAGLWVANLFTPEKERNDLNGDGAINLRDMYFFW
jgi:hypothetical protein